MAHIDDTLINWIAQSESWRTFLDFNLPLESIANYGFLRRYDDFYISLFGKLDEIKLKDIDSKELLLSLAKGFETYTLNYGQGFKGINKKESILIVSVLNYLADYSASAYLLAKSIANYNFEDDVVNFLSGFLNRYFYQENSYSLKFNEYLRSGNIEILHSLIEEIQTILIHANIYNPYYYHIYRLTYLALKKFESNNIWTDLLEYNSSDYWSDFVQAIVDKPLPIWDFFPSQRLAIKRGILGNSKTVSLAFSTSAGKTSLCELIIYDIVRANPTLKILYLAPYRSLASELKNGLCQRLKKLGIRSRVFYGGNTSKSEDYSFDDTELIIATPEKFLAIENLITNNLDAISTVICDEGHLLDGEYRGLSYELLLARLKILNPTRRFIFLSAIIPNIDEIHAWLGGTASYIISSKYKPTEIEYAFLKKMPKSTRGLYYLDINPTSIAPKNFQLYNFLTYEDFIYTPRHLEAYEYPSKSGYARSIACALKSLPLGSVALFSPSKSGPKGVIKLAEKTIDIVSKHTQLPSPLDRDFCDYDRLEDLHEYFSAIFGKSFILSRLILSGALVHYGDLPQNVRELIEFAIANNWVRLLICTNTLSEGVNLPIRTLVIHSTTRFVYPNQQVQIKYRDIKNLVGRTGRAGIETKGLVIVPNQADFYAITHVIQDDANEKVRGYLYLVLKSISQYIINRRLTFTEEFIDSQDEEFQQLIDIFDSAIIDLLAEEIEPSDLIEQVKRLAEQTLSFVESSETEKTILMSLFEFRAKKLLPIVGTDQFYLLKKVGTNIRNFNEIKNYANAADISFTDIHSPYEEKLIEYILNFLFGLSSFNYCITEFNNQYSSAVDKPIIKTIIVGWLKGKWYEELSNKVGLSVDDTLKIMNSLIFFQALNLINSLIRYLEVESEKADLELNPVVLNFGTYLEKGLSQNIDLMLLKIGFNDRLIILWTKSWIFRNYGEEIDFKKLNRIILSDSRYINDMTDQLPALCVDHTIKILSSIG